MRTAKALVIKKRTRAIGLMGNTVRRPSRIRGAKGSLEIIIIDREGARAIPRDKLTSVA